MTKKKICVVITARPSYSRIKTALRAIDNHPNLELQLVVAASALLDRYGSLLDFINEDGFEIAAEVFMVIEGSHKTSMAKTTGIGISELSGVFNNLKPDAVVTIADRFETMSTAIAASYMNIPLVHIQGGEVTGNIDEKVRHAITKLSDLHLVTSSDAKERVMKLGEKEDVVLVTGCPSIDLADEVKQNRALDFDVYRRYGGVGNAFGVEPKKYLVVLQHPVTTEYNSARAQITMTLDAIRELDIPTFWFWPNVDAGTDGTSSGIRSYREKFKDLKIHFFKNMEGKDFLKLIGNSMCLIGNSSVGIRESSYLGIPVVNIGTRQNKRLRGPNVMDVDYDKDQITSAVQKQMENGFYSSSNIYGSGDAGLRIAEELSKWNPTFNKVITY